MCVQLIHKSKYYRGFSCSIMVQERSSKRNNSKVKAKTASSEIQEFYLMEKLYQAMRDDKLRGKRPSAKEFYLMEKLYQVMVIDKNRNKKLQA